MGTKANPGRYDCYAAAAEDEPMFVLLGRDPHAPAAIDKWADDRRAMIQAGLEPKDDIEKVHQARAIADEMRAYFRKRKYDEMVAEDIAAGRRVQTAG